jgi:Ca2+-binding RTX toxin-like protein
VGLLGADSLTGGASRDTFGYVSGADIAAGETVNGRGGVDAISIAEAGEYDFSLASLTSIELLSISIRGGGTFIFNEHQIGGGAIQRVDAFNLSSDHPNHLFVSGSSVNLSDVNFFAWESRDTIAIVGNSILANHLVGSNQADTIIGAPGSDDVMRGHDGRDVLIGGTSNDILTGNLGNDRFVFDAVLTDATTINLDHITDFDHSHDVIKLQHTIFSHIPVGSLSSDAFHLGANPGDAADRILYGQGHGRLYYDPDGTGSQAKVLFAILDNHATVSRGDFLIS